MHAPMWFTLYVCMHACVCVRERKMRGEREKERKEGLSVSEVRGDTDFVLELFSSPHFKTPFPCYLSSQTQL